MKKIIILLVIITFQIFSQQKDLTGIWTGKLVLPNSLELTIVFNLSKDDDGIYTSTLDSPDQGAMGITTESTSITNDSILIKIPIVKGFFTGKIFFEDKKIVGEWWQNGMSLDLTLNKVDKFETPKRPQEPKEPFPYNSEEVLFENEVDNVVLAGTLTYPEKGNNFPAVVLITGSGGQNRDEEIFGHKPFLVISDYLTRNGIAVLRYDDRGIAQSTGDFSKATTEDFSKDVLAAVKFLKERKEIDKTKIGLIGHSEGGMIAPIAAVKSDDIAFIILMAGPGIPGDSTLYLQSELIQKANGVSEEEIKKSTEAQREIFSIIKTVNDDTLLEKRLEDKLSNQYSKMSEVEKRNAGDLKVFLKTQMQRISSPWFRYFVRYNPEPVLEKVKCPVLAINGEKDLQVPPKENLSAIESALKKGGNKNFKVEELAGLNHLFQTSKTGSVTEYGIIEETISPVALQTMLDWIKTINNK